MIINSWVWKKELKKEIRTFTKFASATDFLDKTSEIDYYFFKVEKFFFVTSFIIRKLHESNKLSDELIAINIALKKYPRKDLADPYDDISRYDIDKFFDLSNPINCSLGPMTLCNFFVHSFYFFPYFDIDTQPGKNLLSGVLFTSDKSSKTAMYGISLEAFVSFIQQVINDDIVSKSFSRTTGKIRKSKYNIKF